MKGLNVKRIAAIGLGAALVGSVLAPAVMAATVNNLGTTLKKTDIVSEAGIPVVDIIVGSQGKAPDVVWAGNIAAKVAQLAVSPVAGAGATKTVDFTIGGTTTTVGDGELVDDADVDDTTGIANLGLVIDNSDATVLFEDDIKYDDADDDEQTIEVVETLTSGAIAAGQPDGDGVLAGQIVANIDEEDLVYEITFDVDGAGIENFDNADNVDLELPFLGKTWKVRSIDDDLVELRSSELSEKMFVDDSIKVNGIGTYAGKQLDLVLTDVSADEDDEGDYIAEFELRDGTTVIDVISDAVAAEDFSDFEDYMDTPVTIDVIYRQIDTSKGYVRLDTGDMSLDLEDDTELKDDLNDDNDSEKWIVDLDEVAGELTSIRVYNRGLTYLIADADSTDLEGEDDDAFRMGPMAVGESVDIADAGMYKFEFLGLTTEEMFEGKIAEGVLSLTVDKKVQEVPLAFGGSSGYTENSSKVIEVLGEEYTLYYDEDAGTLKVWNDISDTVDEDEDEGDYEIVFDDTSADVFDDSEILTLEDGDIDVSYNVVAYFPDDDEIVYVLGLSNVNPDLAVEAGTDAVVELVGTSAQSDDSVDDADTETIPYYLSNSLPDDIFENFVTPDGDGLLDDDQDTYSAEFSVDDGDGTVITVLVDTETGNLIDTDADYAGVTSADPQATFDVDGDAVDLDNGEEDALKATGTPFGTEVSVMDDEFAWAIPEEERDAMFYLGGMETSEDTTGGAEYTGVKVDEVKGNVTIDAINGGATTGFTVNKVSRDLVKLDTATPNGKSIIVGGYLVNSQATTLMIDGVSIQERLKNGGDWVAAVLPEGKIVVAGWTAEDTGSAASALITALEGFM